MRNWRMVVSLAVFSGILPVVLWGVVSGQPNKLISKADQASELRVWFEPSDIKMKKGETTDVSIMAGYDDETKIIPRLEMNISSIKGLAITPASINYKNAFNGSVNVATIKVKAENTGSFEVNVPDSGIYTGINDLKAIIYPAKIVVEP